MPTYNLITIQLGQETTWGTGVAATAVLMGFRDGHFTVESEMYQPEEKGVLYPSGHVEQVKLSGSGEFEMDLSYEDGIFVWDGIFGDCTPTGSDPYTWTYTAPTTSTVAPREYTMELGCSGAEYQLIGGIFNNVTVSGDVDGDGVWQAEVEYIGSAVEAEAMTGALSYRDVELITMADTTLYIDAVGGTIGTTEISDALVSFELEVEPNYHLKHFAGDINAASFGYGVWEGTLGMTLEFTSAVKAYVDALLSAKVEKQIRLQAVSGSKEATIDFAGYIEEPPDLFDDRDGNVVVELEWQGAYNSTLSNWFGTEWVNSVATLP